MESKHLYTKEKHGFRKKLKNLKKDSRGAGEMAQWLRALAVLAEDPGSQHPHCGSQPSVTPGSEDLTPSGLYKHQVYTWYLYIHTSKHS